MRSITGKRSSEEDGAAELQGEGPGVICIVCPPPLTFGVKCRSLSCISRHQPGLAPLHPGDFHHHHHFPCLAALLRMIASLLHRHALQLRSTYRDCKGRGRNEKRLVISVSNLTKFIFSRGRNGCYREGGSACVIKGLNRARCAFCMYIGWSQTQWA